MRYFAPISLAVLMLTIGCEHRPAYPISSVNEIPVLLDEPEWQHVETLGNNTGPYKNLMDAVLNAGANKKTISYIADGTVMEKRLDIEEEVLIRRFENPQGDSLVMIYKRQ